jgi:hypothetical protein
MTKKTIVINTCGSDSYWITSFGQRINKDTYLTFLSRYLKVDKNCELNIEISSEGGSPFYSMLIANIILNHKGFTTAYVDTIALCGATLIALMCDKLVINENAVLSPINKDLYIPSTNQSLGSNSFFSCFSMITDKYSVINSNHIEKLFNEKYNYSNNNNSLVAVDNYVSTLMSIFCSNDSECMPIFTRDLPLNYLNIEIINNKSNNFNSDNIIDCDLKTKKSKDKFNEKIDNTIKIFKNENKNKSNKKLKFNRLNMRNQNSDSSESEYISPVCSTSDSE